MDTEVIIVGGGLIGCTVAALLAKQDIRSLIVEERVELLQTSQANIDPRALAITRASENILRVTDAWQYIAEDKIGYFRKMHVWDANGNGEILFDSAELCEPTLGFIIEQTELEKALFKTINQYDQIEFVKAATPAALITKEDQIIVQLEDGQRLKTCLVVAADGNRSKIRQLANIAYPKHDYHQQAVACIVKTEMLHGQVARQRFLSSGPLAFLPLANTNQCGIVWSTTPGRAIELLEMDEASFNNALADAFDFSLGEILSSGPRASFPLQHAQAEQYCQPHIVLVGDAAHSVHPLAGLGANLGLLDAAALAEVLIDSKHRGCEFGNHAVLRRYERWRKGENYLMLKILQSFKYLFENRLESIKSLRNIGLNLVDASSPVKHCIMRKAMGLTGDLPVYARTASQLVTI